MGSVSHPMAHASSVKFRAVHNVQVMDCHVKSVSRDFTPSLQNASFALGIVSNAQAVMCAQNWPILEVES